eukprot:4008334-Lingulodinium_polyedra.AAC.1
MFSSIMILYTRSVHPIRTRSALQVLLPRGSRSWPPWPVRLPGSACIPAAMDKKRCFLAFLLGSRAAVLHKFAHARPGPRTGRHPRASKANMAVGIA